MNFCERAVFAEDGQGFEKDLIVGARGPIREVMNHEIRGEEVGPVAAGSIALRGAGEVELGLLQKRLLYFETSVEGIFGVFCNQKAEKIRTHSGVQILTDF